MKYILAMSIQLLFALGLMAQSGIKFDNSNWDALLAKAKANNTILFVDAYAVWCGPCKKMDSDVFTLAAVGDFYNSNFIPAKIDMEKGEGPAISSRYGVAAYPSFLFINGDGELLHRGIGYKSAEQFLDMGRAAKDPARSLSGMAQRYDKGERSADFLYEYAMARFEVFDDSHLPIVENYLAVQTDWSDARTMELIMMTTNTPSGKTFDYIINNRNAFKEQFGEEAVQGQLQQIVFEALLDESAELPPLSEVDAMLTKVFPDAAEQLIANFRMTYYQRKEDYKNFAKATVDYYDKYPAETADEWNNAAWMFYELVDDKAMLEKAIVWAQKSIALNSNYYNNDTLAWLYHKAGRKKEAKKAAEKAIAIAKETGMDYSGTEDILK